MFRRFRSRSIMLWVSVLSWLVACGLGGSHPTYAAGSASASVTLSASPNPVVAGQPLTLTATVQPSNAPTATVSCGPAASQGYYSGLASFQSAAQVFTAPVSGMLTDVAADISPAPSVAAPIDFALTSWTGSAPGSTLVTGTLTGAQLGGLEEVAFTGSPPLVTQGATYALVFSVPGSNSTQYSLSIAQTPCSGDPLYDKNSGNGWTNDYASSVFTLGITPMPTGTVTFQDATDGTTLGTVPVGTSGTATLTLVSPTTSGTISWAADYSGDSTYASATGSATVTVNPGAPATLTLSGPSTGTVASRVGPFTLTVTDVYGNPTPVSLPMAVLLQASLSGVAFYPGASGGAPITSATVPAGSATATFWLAGTQAGALTMIAQGPSGIAGGSWAVTLQPAAPALLTVTGPTSGAVGTRVGPYTLTVTDVYGNPSPVASPLTLSLQASTPGVTFYPSATASAATTTVAVYAGADTATFWLAGSQPGATTVTAESTLGSASLLVGLEGGPTLSFAPTSLVSQATSPPGLLVPLYLSAPPGSTGSVPVTVYGEAGAPPSLVGAVYASATAQTPVQTVYLNPGSTEVVYFGPGPVPSGTTVTLVAQSSEGASAPIVLTITAPSSGGGSPSGSTSSGGPSVSGSGSSAGGGSSGSGTSVSGSGASSRGTSRSAGSGGIGGGGGSGSPSPSTPPSSPVSTTLFPAGNTVAAPDVTLAVPPGAVQQPTPVTLTPLTAWPPSHPALPGPVLAGFQATLGAGAGSLLQPLTVHLTVPWPPGAPPDLVVTFWNPLTRHWQLVPHTTTAGTLPGSLQVTFQTWHFTTFVVTTPAATPPVARLAGATRMTTAIATAEAAFPDGAESAVLVNAGTGGPSPDALAAAGLAGALHAPILLTPGSALDPTVLAALRTLGTRTVYVVGGPAAIGDAVVAPLHAHHLTVVRAFEGATRFATARLVDQYLIQHHLTAASTVFVANGATLVDALAASPVLDRAAAPLLLVAPGQTTLSAATAAWLHEQAFRQVVVLGGPQAVSAALAQALGHATGAPVLRLGGATRIETAVAVATHFFGAHPEGAVVASSGADGSSFVDALAGAPLAATNQVPLLLTNPGTLPSATAQYLQAVAPGSPVWVLGGPQAVSASVATALRVLGA